MHRRSRASRNLGTQARWSRYLARPLIHNPRSRVPQECALTAVDVIARRTRLAYMDAGAAAEALPAIVDLMAGPLKWTQARKREETERAHAFLATMVAQPAAPAPAK